MLYNTAKLSRHVRERKICDRLEKNGEQKTKTSRIQQNICILHFEYIIAFHFFARFTIFVPFFSPLYCVFLFFQVALCTQICDLRENLRPIYFSIHLILYARETDMQFANISRARMKHQAAQIDAQRQHRILFCAMIF